MQLTFFEYFRNLPVPESLKNDLVDSTGKLIPSFNKISHINIFLGSNNSGKSRLIRELIKEFISPIFISQGYTHLVNEIFNQARISFNDILQQAAQNSPSLNPNRYSDIRNYYLQSTIKLNSNYIENIFKGDLDIITLSQKCKKFIKDMEATTFVSVGDQNSSKSIDKSISIHIKDKILKAYQKANEELDKYVFKEEYERIYIPSQRTLKTLFSRYGAKNEIAKEYKFVLSNPEDLHSEKGIFIENGETFYNDILYNLTSGHVNRKKVEGFEKFLSENFFENNRIDLIPYTKSIQELHIKIGDEKEQAIYDLGDGLQMLIILTWPFFNYKYGIISLEEPELFLHPGLQKKLIEIYSSHPLARNFIFFISTHSNHIIDNHSSLENISIFTIRKDLDNKDTSTEKLPKFVVENVGSDNLNALSLLGVTNSSVYLANCTIWVEGITDKLYLSQFISCYLNDKNSHRKNKYEKCLKYKEGLHYSFVLSGGDSIIHWDFNEDSFYSNGNEKIIVHKLCGKSFVIVDNDLGKNVKRKKKLEKDLGMRFYVLPVVEIENLLGFETVINTLKQYKSCENIKREQLKQPNDKIFRETRLGSLIDNYILKNYNGNHIKKFSKAGGSKNNSTLQNKIEFCLKSLNQITPENLPQPTIKTVEKILDFIIEHN